ncbi:MAG: YbdD/YjiX family protein [Uliginosibacterium sp.]|nr:YbdD/YjiX family protein [Uliginosibacterium sp.]
MFNNLARMGQYLGQAAKMMVGMPDYDAYVQHTRLKHPDREPMSYEAFFRERQDARYASSVGKCC